MRFTPFLFVLSVAAIATAIGVPVWRHYAAEVKCDGVHSPSRTTAKRIQVAHGVSAGLMTLLIAGSLVVMVSEIQISNTKDSWWDEDAKTTSVSAVVYGAIAVVLLGLISAVVGGCLHDRNQLSAAYTDYSAAATQSFEERNAAAARLAEAQGRHFALVVAAIAAFGPMIVVLTVALALVRQFTDIKDIISNVSQPGTSMWRFILKALGFS